MTTDPSPSIQQLLAIFDERIAELEQPLSDGIRRHRMKQARLRLRNADGSPARNRAVTIRQTGQDFLFGCNLFQLGGFETPEQNRAYERALLDLFNSGVVPFYWAGLEPARDQLRFAADSAPIARRPPPDTVIDFCERHGITPKGHCLVWHQLLPEWLPEDPREVEGLITRRIEKIARRYGHRIALWDVVNEPLEKYLFKQVTQLPDNYVEQAYRVAEKEFPASARLFLNEATRYSWREFHGRTTGLHLLEENLRLRGCKVDGIGLQYHYFFYDQNGLTASVNDLIRSKEVFLDPCRLLAILDSYAGICPGRPIHISEITIPTYPDLPHDVAEELQAAIAQRLYRLWFSHPSVSAIFWWNLPDGYAQGAEGALNAGLLRKDLSPKPAYETLRRLIREEWTTCLETRTDEQGVCEFCGFHGDYALVVDARDAPGTTLSLGLHADSSPEISLQIGAAGGDASRSNDHLVATESSS